MKIDVVISDIDKSAVQTNNLILIIFRNLITVYKTTGLSKRNIKIKDMQKFVIELTMLVMTIYFSVCFLYYIFRQ